MQFAYGQISKALGLQLKRVLVASCHINLTHTLRNNSPGFNMSIAQDLLDAQFNPNSPGFKVENSPLQSSTDPVAEMPTHPYKAKQVQVRLQRKAQAVTQHSWRAEGGTKQEEGRAQFLKS